MTMIRPFNEATHREVMHSLHTAELSTVERYLKGQGRFPIHPKRSDHQTIAHIHATIERYWNKTKRLRQ